MSAANDGARATSGERQDSGITSHGVCPARGVAPGMSVMVNDEWEVVHATSNNTDTVTISTPSGALMAHPADWVKVREAGWEYTDE